VDSTPPVKYHNQGVISGGGKLRPSGPLARHPLWDSMSRKSGRSKRQDMKTRFTCRRRRCLPPSSPFVLKGQKPSPRPNFSMGNDPGRHQLMQILPSMHVKSLKAIIKRRAGVTVPRATRCTGRVAPGQPSPAAPSRARQPGPPWGPRGARRRFRYAPMASWVGPVVSVPASPSRRRRSRPPRRVPRLRWRL